MTLTTKGESMPRILPVNQNNADQATAQLLQGVKKKMGMVPNLISTMAQSTAVANAYLGFSGALQQGNLPAKTREQIALAVGQANECDYCLAAHSTLGKHAGLDESGIEKARLGTADDPRDAAVLGFAKSLVQNRGHVDDRDLQSLRDQGYSEGDIAEIVANVALNLFTNYFNHVAETEVDFPAASVLAS